MAATYSVGGSRLKVSVYVLESVCVKIVWQREFLLQEVKV
jgi:hypothetical protein